MCHVLIIEDEWLIAEYLADLAEEAGATSIATACTETEAVEAANARRPGIILSDVVLGSGTGPQAVQRIVSALGQIPVLFITATPEACHSCATPGTVLHKPIDAALMIATFRQFAPL